jgi:type IV fimbrial biogenesis protein FimT
MRRAFTLPELVLVLAVTGILLGIAVPQLSRAMNQIEVEAATAHLVAAHQRARVMAITRGQVLTLSIDSAALIITPRSGGPPLWSEVGPAAAGVSLVGPTRRFTFSPEGLTLGLSNASLQLARGSSTRTVVISRLGRVRVLR